MFNPCTYDKDKDFVYAEYSAFFIYIVFIPDFHLFYAAQRYPFLPFAFAPLSQMTTLI